ncbi:DUF3857 domain-containing protein [Oceanihabitans sediminis]|uniref:DUF3857 domain-containing protein n=1 Tax=Oceanihabitans sediminis TaxID=1812012 RepID=UPI00299EE4C4|nr:DUF3857 domain-containing protein [Oceanihabitans sediminis]MDX1278808.1 DUF3857 domain-containing protein [Oceanihabitans sediminis]
MLVFSSTAQEFSLQSLIIDSSLRENANAIVRQNDLSIEVLKYDKILVKQRRVVTILNSSGNSKVNAYLHYDENVNIKKLEAIVYNAYGKEIKKIRKNKFSDANAVDGFSLYSDSRIKYLDYTPTNYPYTIEYIEEYETSFTVNLPSWYPLDGYYTSVENSTYTIINDSNVEISLKTENLENYNIDVLSEYSFQAKNLKAIKPEQYSPSFAKIVPSVKATLKEFSMKGVKGVNSNWQDFGKWMNDKLIAGTQELPQAVKDEIKALTANAETDIEKAKIVYNYMQDKTRYISIQVGIGGWKPMLASDVDRLGYGDCKGLTNYTMALLQEVGVPSYYTVVYGDSNLRNIDDSFSSLQGNHVILTVPNKSDYIFLECTSQTVPFGYTANFTDDRDVLLIKPEGGEIVRTKSYKTEENLLDTRATIKLDAEGSLEAHVVMNSYGTQYGSHEGVQNETEKNQQLYYKDYWNYINNLEINSLDFTNNKDSIVFIEEVELKAARYAVKTGDRLLLQPNMFNRIETAPKRYKDRNLPFEVERGFTDIDEYIIEIPETLEVEATMNPVSIKNKFGEYIASVSIENNKLLYHRKFVLNKGAYTKDEYKEFRSFWLSVVKQDKSKIVLKTKP